MCLNNKNPLLAICIPTYNRANVLKECLDKFTSEKIFINSNLVEIIISDNCSTDNTKEVCLKFVEKFPNKIRYYQNSENIFDKNFTKVLSYSRSIYSKLNNDYLYFKEGQLEKIVKYLTINQDIEMIFFLSSKEVYKKRVIGFDELVNDITYNVTFIGGMCYKTESYKKITNPSEYSELHFCQIGVCAKLLSHHNQGIVYSDNLFDSIPIKKGGYSIPEVFGYCFLSLMYQLFEKKIISKNTLKKTKKELLLKHINWFCFRKYKHNYSFAGYMKYLLPYYKYDYYFYLDFFVRCLNKFFYHIFSIRKERGNKILVLFGCKIIIRKY